MVRHRLSMIRLAFLPAYSDSRQKRYSMVLTPYYDRRGRNASIVATSPADYSGVAQVDAAQRRWHALSRVIRSLEFSSCD
jgi:hypothetical protein